MASFATERVSLRMMARQVKIYGVIAACLLLFVNAVAADPDVIAQVADRDARRAQPHPGRAGRRGASTRRADADPHADPGRADAFLEAKDYANVRAEPSTESAHLGTINAGETYTVLGRYASWIQFQFQSSPTGKGWVYDELVDLSGNTDNIPDIDPYAADQQLDSASLGATATQNVLTQTPGGVLTATAISQQGGLPSAVTSTPEGTRGILPTFTYPPGLIAIAPTAAAPTSDLASGQRRPQRRDRAAVERQLAAADCADPDPRRGRAAGADRQLAATALKHRVIAKHRTSLIAQSRRILRQ